MKIYQVGGSVRDELLGVSPSDLDYVIVNSSPDEMEELGYKPVGSSFPVYLHPETGDEFALARTEKSTGTQYKDFDVYFGKDVTLEDDLKRRDLSVNSIAKDINSDELYDPYGGVKDLNDKILRHTSVSFTDDPVRVLRLARFYAVFGEEWTIAPETKELCDKMFESGMLKGLTPERVWKETEKALGGVKPSLYFNFLKEYNIFPMIKEMEAVVENNPHHPEKNLWVHVCMVMDMARKLLIRDKEVVFANLTHDFGKPICYKERGNGHGHEEAGLPFIEDFCKRFKVPNNYRDLALLVCKHHQKIHACMSRGSNDWTRPKSIMKLFTETNALVKPERFSKILSACVCDAKGRGDTLEQRKEFFDKAYPQEEYLWECLEAAKAVNTKTISKELLDLGKSGVMIGEQIRVARINAIRGVQKKWKKKQNIG